MKKFENNFLVAIKLNSCIWSSFGSSKSHLSTIVHWTPSTRICLESPHRSL